MEKVIYLVWAEPGAERNVVQAQLLAECAPRLLELGPRGLSIDVDDSDSDVPPPVPWPAGETPLCAVVSLWVDCYERCPPYGEVLAEVGDRLAGYLVTESLYSDYGTNRHASHREWPDGARSPGLLTVSLLERPERLDPRKWLEHWHGTQSPVSEAMQPRCRYVRNAVVRPLTPGAPPYEGIVEEAWPSTEHVTDPMLFYGAEGSVEKLRRNQRRMFESVRAFLDLDRLRVSTMSEYLLKT